MWKFWFCFSSSKCSLFNLAILITSDDGCFVRVANPCQCIWMPDPTVHFEDSGFWPKILIFINIIISFISFIYCQILFFNKKFLLFCNSKIQFEETSQAEFDIFVINKDLMITIPCCVAVVQNLAILYQGKRLTREEEECQHLLASKEKCPAKKKRKTKPILPKIYTFFAFWRIHICYNYFFRKKCHRRKNCSGCNW